MALTGERLQGWDRSAKIMPINRALTERNFPWRLWRARVDLIKKLAFEHEMGRHETLARVVAFIRLLAAGIGTLTVACAAPAESAAARHGESAITCTNPFSGARWQIRIDYDRSTVDSNPARISDAEISWRDATDGWNYRLDRKSGNLTVILASATGGNFLHDRCELEN